MHTQKLSPRALPQEQKNVQRSAQLSSVSPRTVAHDIQAAVAKLKLAQATAKRPLFTHN